MEILGWNNIQQTEKLKWMWKITMTKRKNRGLLRSKDAAHILDCSPDDVVDLARKGKVRGVKEGRFWRFRIADINAYKKKLDKLGRGEARKGSDQS
jgi:excisionase family DNA binding protein